MIIDNTTRCGIFYAKDQRLTLSQRERRYRMKFIQKRHLNKYQQRDLDTFMAQGHFSYKHIYTSKSLGDLTPEMMTMAVDHFVKSMSAAPINYDLAYEGVDRLIDMEREGDK